MLSEIVFILEDNEKLKEKFKKITDTIKKKILLRLHLITVFQTHLAMEEN